MNFSLSLAHDLIKHSPQSPVHCEFLTHDTIHFTVGELRVKLETHECVMNGGDRGCATVVVHWGNIFSVAFAVQITAVFS